MNTENDTQGTETVTNPAAQPAADPGQSPAHQPSTITDQPFCPPPKPFDRQPGESEKAFAAFRIYLDMGPSRSISDAARRRGFQPKHFNYWAHRFHWRARAAAYEEHLAHVRRQAQEQALRQQTIDWTHLSRLAHEQQWQLAQTTLDAAHKLLSLCLAKAPREIRLFEVVRCLEAGAKLHRRAACLDQPPPAAPPGPNDGLPDGFMEALRRVYGDAESGSSESSSASDPEGPDPQALDATLQKPPQDMTRDKSHSQGPRPQHVTTADSLNPPHTIK